MGRFCAGRRLLIRPGAIGDCIVSFPALESLVADYTEVWVPSPVAPLVRFADLAVPLSSTGLNMVGVGDRPAPPRLLERLRSFDSIMSWYGANRDEFRAALRQEAISCEFHPALPPPGYPDHAVDFFAKQIGAAAGLIPRVHFPPVSQRAAVIIHPFSGSRKKNWRLHSFQELARQLSLEVEWTAGPEEELPNATRFDDLADLARWISGSRLYIGNDSGIAHLAAAVGVPALVLFGPTNPEVWAPRGQHVIALSSNPLDELSVDRVLCAANRLLGSHSS